MELSTMYKMMEDTFFEHEKCGLINVEYLRLADPYLGEWDFPEILNLFKNINGIKIYI